jgi:hypothetical protein
MEKKQKFPWQAQIQAILSVHLLGRSSTSTASLIIGVARYSWENPGALEFYTMIMVEPVFRHHRLLWMSQPYHWAKTFLPFYCVSLCLLIKYMFHLTFSFSHIAHIHGSVCVMKINLMYYLSSVYLVKKPLHVSCVFLAQHQDIPTRTTDSQLKSTKHTNWCIYTVHLLMMGYKYARNM